MRQQNRTESHLQSKGGNKQLHACIRVMVEYWTIPVFLWATSGTNVFFLISSYGEFLPQSKCQWRKTNPAANVPYSYQQVVHLEQWPVGIHSAPFQVIPDLISLRGRNKLPAYIFPSTFMIVISIQCHNGEEVPTGQDLTNKKHISGQTHLRELSVSCVNQFLAPGNWWSHMACAHAQPSFSCQTCQQSTGQNRKASISQTMLLSIWMQELNTSTGVLQCGWSKMREPASTNICIFYHILQNYCVVKPYTFVWHCNSISLTLDTNKLKLEVNELSAGGYEVPTKAVES